MFDNPRKELRQLEDQLLAAEMKQQAAELNQEEFEELYNGILEEFGPRHNPGGTTESTGELPIRNFANGYGGVVPSAHTDTVTTADDANDAEPRKGFRGLAFLAILEVIAIAGLAAYWALNWLGLL